MAISKTIGYSVLVSRGISKTAGLIVLTSEGIAKTTGYAVLSPPPVGLSKAVVHTVLQESPVASESIFPDNVRFGLATLRDIVMMARRRKFR